MRNIKPVFISLVENIYQTFKISLPCFKAEKLIQNKNKHYEGKLKIPQKKFPVKVHKNIKGFRYRLLGTCQFPIDTLF